MDIRVAVTVLGVLLSQALGHPGAVESGVANSEGAKKIVPLEVSTSSEVKKTLLEEKEESSGKLKVPQTSLGAKLKARLQEDSKLPTSSKEVQDEAVRSTRQLPSSPYQQMSFGKGPHTTTVCIQVRSDHQPQVICGPQYGEQEVPPAPPAAARYASPFEYARPAPQGYARAPPAPARGFPSRRAEEDPRPSEQNLPQPASGLAPQNAPPSRLQPAPPVYVHSQAFKPVYSAGLVSPLQALMRLNCAVEPAGQYLSPQLIRGGPLGYPEQSFGDSLFTLPDGSAAKFGANLINPAPVRTQNNFLPSQQGYQQYARSSAEEDMAYLNSQMLGSPQNYPAEAGAWNYNTYQGESYPLDMMQGRSASGEERMQAYLGYPADYPTAADDYARKELIQLQALRESKERLRAIQEELTVLREREELQKMSSKNASNPETSKDPSGAGISIDIKATPTKTSKRHTRTQ